MKWGGESPGLCEKSLTNLQPRSEEFVLRPHESTSNGRDTLTEQPSLTILKQAPEIIQELEVPVTNDSCNSDIPPPVINYPPTPPPPPLTVQLI